MPVTVRARWHKTDCKCPLRMRIKKGSLAAALPVLRRMDIYVHIEAGTALSKTEAQQSISRAAEMLQRFQRVAGHDPRPHSPGRGWVSSARPLARCPGMQMRRGETNVFCARQGHDPAMGGRPCQARRKAMVCCRSCRGAKHSL